EFRRVLFRSKGRTNGPPLAQPEHPRRSGKLLVPVPLGGRSVAHVPRPREHHERAHVRARIDRFRSCVPARPALPCPAAHRRGRAQSCPSSSRACGHGHADAAGAAPPGAPLCRDSGPRRALPAADGLRVTHGSFARAARAEHACSRPGPPCRPAFTPRYGATSRTLRGATIETTPRSRMPSWFKHRGQPPTPNAPQVKNRDATLIAHTLLAQKNKRRLRSATTPGTK